MAAKKKEEYKGRIDCRMRSLSRRREAKLRSTVDGGDRRWSRGYSGKGRFSNAPSVVAEATLDITDHEKDF